MIQFIPLVIIPQIFFAGIFPLEGMSNWLQTIGKSCLFIMEQMH